MCAVCAGCVIIRVDESHLTGESDDVIKESITNPILMSGSKVMDGFGSMLVVAVGPNSQQGIINTMVLNSSSSSSSGAQSDGSSSSNSNASATPAAAKSLLR